MKAQTRKGALVESGVNILVGFGLSYGINYLFLPAFGMTPSHADLFGLGAIFTIASVVRSYVLRRVFERLRVRQAPPEFLYIAEELAAERHRQISGEHYCLDHDDQHDRGELAMGALAYVYIAAKSFTRLGSNAYLEMARAFWPWEESTFRPTTPRRDLVKAGAMIIAEIGRMDRAARRRA